MNELDERGLPRGYAFDAELEVTPREVKRLIDDHAEIVLIDCRLPAEHALTKIDGAELIPLQQIQQHGERLLALKDKQVIVHCKVGGRSLQFAKILKANGIDNVRSMAGGILLWNRDVAGSGPTSY
jgi:sulfur-carrier protein adenylyltransferase/sulfurtransferase